jgi:hypothetical protein
LLTVNRFIYPLPIKTAITPIRNRNPTTTNHIIMENQIGNVRTHTQLNDTYPNALRRMRMSQIGMVPMLTDFVFLVSIVVVFVNFIIYDVRT